MPLPLGNLRSPDERVLCVVFRWTSCWKSTWHPEMCWRRSAACETWRCHISTTSWSMRWEKKKGEKKSVAELKISAWVSFAPTLWKKCVLLFLRCISNLYLKIKQWQSPCAPKCQHCHLLVESASSLIHEKIRLYLFDRLNFFGYIFFSSKWMIMILFWHEIPSFLIFRLLWWCWSPKETLQVPRS